MFSGVAFAWAEKMMCLSPMLWDILWRAIAHWLGSYDLCSNANETMAHGRFRNHPLKIKHSRTVSPVAVSVPWKFLAKLPTATRYHRCTSHGIGTLPGNLNPFIGGYARSDALCMRANSEALPWEPVPEGLTNDIFGPYVARLRWCFSVDSTAEGVEINKEIHSACCTCVRYDFEITLWTKKNLMDGGVGLSSCHPAVGRH